MSLRATCKQSLNKTYSNDEVKTIQNIVTPDFLDLIQWEMQRETKTNSKFKRSKSLIFAIPILMEYRMIGS